MFINQILKTLASFLASQLFVTSPKNDVPSR
jgi:hypothetical protein